MDSMDNVIVVRDSSGRGSAKSTIVCFLVFPMLTALCDDFGSFGNNLQLQTRALSVIDPIKEAEILESIEAAYFINEGFDAIDYELKVNFVENSSISSLGK